MTFDKHSQTTPPRRLSVLDFFSTGPCKQRCGIWNARNFVMTTCPDCPGLMRAGECARDAAKEAISGK